MYEKKSINFTDICELVIAAKEITSIAGQYANGKHYLLKLKPDRRTKQQNQELTCTEQK